MPAKAAGAMCWRLKKGRQKHTIQNSAGGSCLNDNILHVANKHLPFVGGVGESGMGRYHGKFSFETFSHQRSVVSSRLWFDLAGKYPPYKQFGLIKRLLR